MLLADRPTAEQTIGRWRPGHLSERVVTQTLLRTLVAHREAAEPQVKHTLWKQKSLNLKALVHILMITILTVKRISQEINIPDLPGTFRCAKDPTKARCLTPSPCDKIYSINILFIEWHVLKGPLTIKATCGVSCCMNEAWTCRSYIRKAEAFMWNIQQAPSAAVRPAQEGKNLI